MFAGTFRMLVISVLMNTHWQVQHHLNMNQDDLIYIAILLVSVPLGYAIKSIALPKHKQYLASFTGLLILCVVCGFHVWHSLLTIFVNCIIIQLCGHR